MHKMVILLGNGVRGNPRLVEHLCSLGLPVLTTWPAMDLVPENHPAFCGRPGTIGQRAANIILQKADEVWVFGARLDAETTGYDIEGFCDHADMVYLNDVDEAEEGRWKHRANFDFDAVDLNHLDPKEFGALWEEELDGPFPHEWLPWCRALHLRFRRELEGDPCTANGLIDPYRFVRVLSDCCQENVILALTSSSTAANVVHQAFRVKAGQRITNLPTLGAMGADIPMAIGAALSGFGRRVICPTGDGGFCLNLQELETVRRLNLPILFFVFNNNGYGAIRTMQDNRFDGRHVGCDPASGLTLPNLAEVARGFGLPHVRLTGLDPLPALAAARGPLIVELMIDPTIKMLPRVMSSLRDGRWYPDRLEDMTPKLPADELAALMAWGG